MKIFKPKKKAVNPRDLPTEKIKPDPRLMTPEFDDVEYYLKQDVTKWGLISKYEKWGYDQVDRYISELREARAEEGYKRKKGK